MTTFFLNVLAQEDKHTKKIPVSPKYAFNKLVRAAELKVLRLYPTESVKAPPKPIIV